MIKNTKENSLINIKENFFSKIKNFLKRMFFKNKQIIGNKEIIYNKELFKSNILIEENQKGTRLLKLQKDFEENIIEEEELSDEDYKKIHELYDEQIRILKEKIKEYKNEIILIKKQI